MAQLEGYRQIGKSGRAVSTHHSRTHKTEKYMISFALKINPIELELDLMHLFTSGSANGDCIENNSN